MVIEGMPGAGKTAAIERLHHLGHQTVPEYLQGGAHPHVADDAAHQRNWLRKARVAVALAQGGPVHCDRDFLTSLSFAASIAPTDGGRLLRRRGEWAVHQVESGNLVVSDAYVVLDVSPEISLSRRTGRLTSGHPWGCARTLAHLRDFYRDPMASLGAVGTPLVRIFETASWWWASGEDPADVTDRMIEKAREEMRCRLWRCSCTTVGTVAAQAPG